MKGFISTVPNDVRKQLESLKLKTQAANLIEVFRDAVQFYAWMVSEHAKGRKVVSLPMNENLFRNVSELNFSTRSLNCFYYADIKYIGELVQNTEQELLMMKYFGRKSLNETKYILHEICLELGMRLNDVLSRDKIERHRQATKRQTPHSPYIFPSGNLDRSSTFQPR